MVNSLAIQHPRRRTLVSLAARPTSTGYTTPCIESIITRPIPPTWRTQVVPFYSLVIDSPSYYTPHDVANIRWECSVVAGRRL